MSINECPLLRIELLEPTQAAPSPGELEIFPRITLQAEGIVSVEKRSRTPRRNGIRSGARLSRFRTQPITIAEITELDEMSKGNEDNEKKAAYSKTTTGSSTTIMSKP